MGLPFLFRQERKQRTGSREALTAAAPASEPPSLDNPSRHALSFVQTHISDLPGLSHKGWISCRKQIETEAFGNNTPIVTVVGRQPLQPPPNCVVGVGDSTTRLPRHRYCHYGLSRAPAPTFRAHCSISKGAAKMLSPCLKNPVCCRRQLSFFRSA